MIFDFLLLFWCTLWISVVYCSKRFIVYLLARPISLQFSMIPVSGLGRTFQAEGEGGSLVGREAGRRRHVLLCKHNMASVGGDKCLSFVEDAYKSMLKVPKKRSRIYQESFLKMVIQQVVSVTIKTKS